MILHVRLLLLLLYSIFVHSYGALCQKIYVLHGPNCTAPATAPSGVLSISGNIVVQDIPLNITVHEGAIAFSPNGTKVYVATVEDVGSMYPFTVWAINSLNDTIITSIDLGSQTTLSLPSIAFSGPGDKVYVLYPSNPQLFVINALTDKFSHAISLTNPYVSLQYFCNILGPLFTWLLINHLTKHMCPSLRE